MNKIPSIFNSMLKHREIQQQYTLSLLFGLIKKYKLDYILKNKDNPNEINQSLSGNINFELSCKNNEKNICFNT